MQPNNSQESTGPKSPIFGRPLVPYFLQEGNLNEDPRLLKINANHDLTEEQKIQQKTLLLPSDEKARQIRKFNKEGYFVDESMDMREIEQNLNSRKIELVNAKVRRPASSIRVDDDHNTSNAANLYYNEIMKNHASGYKGKQPRNARKKRRKKPTRSRKRQAKRHHSSSTESGDLSSDSSSNSSSYSASSTDHFEAAISRLGGPSDIKSLLNSGGLLSPMDLMQSSSTSQASHHTTNNGRQSSNAPSNTLSNGSSTPPRTNGYQQPTQTQSGQNAPSNQTAPSYPSPSQFPGQTGPFPSGPNLPPFFNQPHFHSHIPVNMMHPPQGFPQMPPGPHDMNFPPPPPPINATLHPPHQGPPQQYVPSQPNQPPQQQQLQQSSSQASNGEKNGSHMTESDLLQEIGVSSKKSKKKQKEKYAGSSWSNSPDPSSLPAPLFNKQA